MVKSNNVKLETEVKVILTTCYHCGNKGNLDVKGMREYFESEKNEPWYHYFHYILDCPVCRNITLYEKYTAEYFENAPNNYEFEQKILYPTTKYNLQYVPENIKNAFESALKVSQIDVAICALSLRRVIEIICKDKGAIETNLMSMVKSLVAQNILPQTFDKATYIIRILGNEGAHGDKFEFSLHDLNSVIKFVSDIINYLYILPKEIEAMEKRLCKKID